MSAGSFWPSPSSVAIQGARASRTPVATAALWPERTEWRISRISGIASSAGAPHGLRRAVRAAVVDEDRFVAIAALERRMNFPGQRQDVVLFVADGNHDRHVEARGSARWRGKMSR